MRRSIATRIGIAVLLAAGGCSEAANTPPAATHVPLDDAATALREDFNRAKGSVRLLFVIDPICPGCLRGLDDVNKALLPEAGNPRLRIFVVHLPVLGAQAKDVEPASRLLKNAHARHYWNGSASFGRQLAEAVGFRKDDALVFAWDVWLVYGPAATWDGALPPKPRRMMHQLRAFQGSTEFPRLDTQELARTVRTLLASLPPPPRPS